MPLNEPFRWKTPVQLQCQQCGAGMLVPPSRAQRKYCSQECKYAAQRRQMAEGARPPPGGPRTPEGRARAQEGLERGRALGTQALLDWMAERDYYWVECTVCGESFPTKSVRRPLYCSLACCYRGSYQRYAQALERICVVCGASFRGHAYRRNRLTCGGSCGAVMQALSHMRTHQDLILYAPDDVATPFAGARPGLCRQTLAGSHKMKPKGRRQNHRLQDA